jgi:GDPmannose 4,6-dehydratase
MVAGIAGKIRLLAWRNNLLSKALILGVDGQDGSYLAEFLLQKDYQVVGWIPKNILVDLRNIKQILPEIVLIEGDLSDQESLLTCLEEHQPQEIYNLASPSSPVESWHSPVQVADIAAVGVARLLEALRIIVPEARFYQASSSELFGNPVQVPQNELTPFNPRNPYGIAKLFAHWMTVNYRQMHGLFAVSGILFNHESPRRGLKFVTRKITRRVAEIKLGLAEDLSLGNLEARRDWGYAGDYIKAMWLMLQQDMPDDFVCGMGETHSVREFCEIAFDFVSLDYRDYVKQDQRYYRPVESAQLVSDPSKATKLLDWTPEVSFEELVQMMVDSDLRLLQIEDK